MSVRSDGNIIRVKSGLTFESIYINSKVKEKCSHVSLRSDGNIIRVKSGLTLYKLAGPVSGFTVPD